MLSLRNSGICFYTETKQQMIKRKQQILENLIYAFIWLILFIIPLAGYSFEGSIHWNDVRKFWVRLLPFVILFLLNNYLLIPKLLFRKKISTIYRVIAPLHSSLVHRQAVGNGKPESRFIFEKGAGFQEK